MITSAACAAEAAAIAITEVVTKDFIFINFAPNLFMSTVLQDYRKKSCSKNDTVTENGGCTQNKIAA